MDLNLEINLPFAYNCLGKADMRKVVIRLWSIDLNIDLLQKSLKSIYISNLKYLSFGCILILTKHRMKNNFWLSNKLRLSSTNKNRKIAPTCDSYLNATHWCIEYSMHCIHCIWCIVFYALYSMLCILFIIIIHCIKLIEFFALCYMHCILCIVCHAFYSMHCILCIVFSAVFNMQIIQCIVLNT
jgi:hypothetical protein